MTDQDLYSATPKDIEFFNRVTEGLPKAGEGLDSNGEPMPYACGPHSVRCMREIIEIVKPKVILEIGFCCGYSSAIWLELSNAFVSSSDISDRQQTLMGADVLRQRHKNRFWLTISDSKLLYEHMEHAKYPNKYDLIFIDGDHSHDGVFNDIELALKMNIKYLAFDDYLPQFGPGVQSAIAKFPQLEMVKILGNIALYKNTSI